MIIQADILKWAEEYDGPLFHALLCDPPYHLTEVTKRFGKADAAPAQYGSDGAFQRASRGFMGKQWDGGDIAFRPETWATIARVLHPGAFGMAFASSRGWHRMAVAIEDAGLIIHPVILAWGYGSGFPKATRLDTQIDRRAGAARETIGTKKHQPKFDAAGHGYREKDNGYNSKDRQSFDVTAPATELAQAWAGHRYGGQAMKPAIEPIIVFQKPYAGRPVDSITRTGAGALWIDGARIGSDERELMERDHQYRLDTFDIPSGSRNAGTTTVGRWPANLILSHSPACNGECAPGCPVAALGAQSGDTVSREADRGQVRIFSDTYRDSEGWVGQTTSRGHDDSGTAARFFFQADYMAERLEAADAVQYQAKASRGEREAGLDPRTVALMRALDDSDFDQIEEHIVYAGDRHAIGRCPQHDEAMDPTTRKATYRCGCTVERRAQFDPSVIDDGRQKPIDNPYQRGKTVRRNTHPTIKPIALARYLATLLLPPAEYAPRRLLIPFSGAGSEIIGADLAGWEEVVGVELEADHVKIAEARRSYWQQRRWELLDPARPITAKTSDAPDGQLDMFLED